MRFIVSRYHVMTGKFFKFMIFAVCLLPFVVLAAAFYTDSLGANPIEAITHHTGEWTLRFLLIVLVVTPLRRYTGWRWPMRLRRMLGLFAFFYASLHLVTYFWFDQFFDWPEIWLDIIDRPFITVGMLAYMLLIPLALTSTNRAMKRLGKRWKKLHRLAYIVPVLGVLHFWWLVKADVLEPLVYAAMLAALLFLRVPAFQALRGKPARSHAG